jgi:hypothetical protein
MYVCPRILIPPNVLACMAPSRDKRRAEMQQRTLLAGNELAASMLLCTQATL